MPHCVLWSDSDWDFAIDSLEVAARFYDGNDKAAGELRQREKYIGTTLDYRRDLRIRYVDKLEEKAVANVPNIADYRE